MADRNRRPWHRREDETEAQWQAFRIYRDLRRERNMQNAWTEYANARGLNADKNSPPHFWEWKNENDWDERVRAFDEHEDRLHAQEVRGAQKAAIENLIEQSERAAQILALVAVGGQDRIADQFGITVDDFQMEAIQDLLDRTGVDLSELDVNIEAEVDGEVEHTGDVAIYLPSNGKERDGDGSESDE